jgi:hypothetical protein
VELSSSRVQANHRECFKLTDKLVIDTQGTEKKTFHLHVIFKLLDAWRAENKTENDESYDKWVIIIKNYFRASINIQLDAGNTHEVCQSRDEHR